MSFKISILRQKLTNSTVQGPSWETDSSSPGKEITLSLSNPKIYCRVHKIPLLNRINCQLKAVLNCTTNFFSIRLNIIFLFLHILTSSLFPSRFPTKILCASLVSSLRAIFSTYVFLIMQVYPATFWFFLFLGPYALLHCYYTPLQLLHQGTWDRQGI
jgi:hypothetical protein